MTGCIKSSVQVVDVARSTKSGLPEPFLDCVYKDTPSGPLYLRIWPSSTVTPSGVSPWAFNIHGGGFLHGDHLRPMIWHSRGFLERGIHVVSISYRFAPHVSFREILGDCLDAYAWCQAHLANIMRRHGRRIDMDRCVSVGGSAGGTLATIIGHIARPRIRCVVNCCGIIDLTKPLPAIRPDPTFLALNEDIITEEKLQLEIRSQSSARATSWCPNLSEDLPPEQSEDGHDPSCTPWVVTRGTKIQFELFKQIFGRNLMIPVVFRRDNFVSDKAYQDELRSFSAINMVDESYPPTIILHGLEDDIVQVEQSRSFARVLKKKRIPVREVYVPDAGHSVGLSWKDENQLEWKTYVRPMLDDIVLFSSA
ncbi:hypothetical protein EHS25_003873 [Saitozyma podzolica]|uniref:Alpha/beta hydrolase fold-3 domain-containing protein n=1 Tax=Saitozyma podzolica TaxID=1890683 RepID=A0A427Y3T1_9TREE|nr:hypothetical protein EHS25_003873 [Saitozyma podzolica]